MGPDAALIVAAVFRHLIPLVKMKTIGDRGFITILYPFVEIRYARKGDHLNIFRPMAVHAVMSAG